MSQPNAAGATQGAAVDAPETSPGSPGDQALEQTGGWPLRIALGAPTESDVSLDPAGVRAWATEWFACSLPGRLESRTRRWARLGEQALPAAWHLDGPDQVARWCGQAERWERARRRKQVWQTTWACEGQRRLHPGQHPDAADGTRINVARVGAEPPTCFFDVLADFEDADFSRLLTALRWLLENPASGLHVRQLPLKGVDTKWVEQRTAVIVMLLAWLRPQRPSGHESPVAAPVAESSTKDFFHVTGLQPLPHRIRLRVLCPALRETIGGLCDIESPIDDLIRLGLKPGAVVIVENLQTGVALPEIDGVVAFMRLGRSVGLLRKLPWLSGVPVWYWGDIDTHGLEILARAREVFPELRTLLMDRTTLLRYRHLAVVEPQQHGGSGLAPLDADERALFEELKVGQWGVRLRLEQERIPWAAVLAELEGIRRVVG